LKKAPVFLILLFLLSFMAVFAGTSYTSKNVLSPLIILVNTDSNSVIETIKCFSKARIWEL